MYFSCIAVFLLFTCLFERVSHCITLADLELNMWARLTNSQSSLCLCFLSAGILKAYATMLSLSVFISIN